MESWIKRYGATGPNLRTEVSCSGKEGLPFTATGKIETLVVSLPCTKSRKSSLSQIAVASPGHAPQA